MMAVKFLHKPINEKTRHQSDHIVILLVIEDVVGIWGNIIEFFKNSNDILGWPIQQDLPQIRIY